MQTKLILFFIIFFVSCGKDVKFTNQLETNSLVTQAAPVAVTQSGFVVKTSATPPGKFIMSGKTYNVSPFSSYMALNFISTQTEGAQVPVRVSGEIKGSEIYIKVIEQ